MTGLRVLVVEDDALIGMLLREMLQNMGYEVCAIAVTEEEAVADATHFKPDLMIVDERLREGSGGSAARRILRTGRIPCVFVSGAPVYPNLPGMMVLQKPFRADDLVRAIQHVTGGGANCRFPSVSA